MKGTVKQVKYASDIISEIKKYQKYLNVYVAEIQETTEKDLSELLNILDLVDLENASDVIDFGKDILKYDSDEKSKREFIIQKLIDAKKEGKKDFSTRYFNKVIELQINSIK